MVSIQVDRLDGLSSATAMKGPCRVATTANITLEGEQTIDTVAVVEGDRVLVKDQTDARTNGIYTVNTGLWTRTKDFSRNRDIQKGTRVYVTDGTVGPGEYAVTSANPIGVGDDEIEFMALLPVASSVLAALLLVDGAGSGLDADLLDGLNSTSFQRTPDAHVQTITASGASTVTTNTTLLRLALTASGTVDLSFPATADRDGAPLRIVDITGNAATVNGVFPSPDTCMGASGTVGLGGSSGPGIGMAFTLTLTPVSDESEWIV